MPGAVTPQYRVMVLALEVQVHVALPGKANTAVELHGATGDKNRHVAGRGLGHVRELRGFLGLVIEGTRRVVDQRARLIDIDHGVHQRVLDRLEEANLPLELLAGAGVFGRGLQLPLAGTHHVGRDHGPDRRHGLLKHRQPIIADLNGLGAVKADAGLVAGEVDDSVGLQAYARRIARHPVQTEAGGVLRLHQEVAHFLGILHVGGATGELAIGVLDVGICSFPATLCVNQRRACRGAADDCLHCGIGRYRVAGRQQVSAVDRGQQRRREGGAAGFLAQRCHRHRTHAQAAGALGHRQHGPAQLDHLLPQFRLPLGGKLAVGVGFVGHQRV